MYGIPVPRYAFVNRETPYQELDYFVEEEDFVEVHGNRFWKPFVEKPVDGEIKIFKRAEYYLFNRHLNQLNHILEYRRSSRLKFWHL